MTIICEVRQQSASPVLTMRGRVPVQALPGFLGKVYSSIFAYYNMDMQDLDIEAGYPVIKPLAGRGEIHASMLPEGLVAETVFTGPYLEMGPAYEGLSHWVKENGYEMCGTVYEVYLNSPAEVAPEQLQTRIVFLLKS
jgi:effector-binding domain-containing protein